MFFKYFFRAFPHRVSSRQVRACSPSSPEKSEKKTCSAGYNSHSKISNTPKKPLDCKFDIWLPPHNYTGGNGTVACIQLLLHVDCFLLSTKENAHYVCTVHEVVTVLYPMRFHGLDALLDWPGTFCLDLMCSVFLTRELVSILWHSFTDETLAIFCLLQVCL